MGLCDDSEEAHALEMLEIHLYYHETFQSLSKQESDIRLTKNMLDSLNIISKRIHLGVFNFIKILLTKL